MGQSAFGREFLISPKIQDVRAKYRSEQAQFETELKCFSDFVFEHLGHVSQHCNELQAMHMARMQVKAGPASKPKKVAKMKKMS